MSEVGQDVSEDPVSQWTADNDDGDQDDAPTLTMTLPPLLLHQEHGQQLQQDNNSVTSPSCQDIITLPSLQHQQQQSKCLQHFLYLYLTLIISVLLSELCHWR